MYHPQCEHRRHPRIRVCLPLRIWPIENEPGAATQASAGTCTNLSRGGVHAVGNEPMAPGRHLRLEISLPDGRRVDVAGRVAWSRTTVSPPVLCARTASIPDCSLGLEFVEEAPAELFFLIRDRVTAQRLRARQRSLRISRRQLVRGVSSA